MLVLTRKRGQEIVIGENITIKVVDVRNGEVVIGITAPREVSVRRQELKPKETKKSHTSTLKSVS